MPSTQEEAQFREAVSIANVPTLLAVLVQLTGDERWLDDPYRPSRAKGLGDNDTGGLADEIQCEVRSAALQAILAWRAGKPPAVPEPSYELLTQILGWCMAEPVPATYAPLIADELSMAKATGPDVPHLDAPEGFRALIIGAGVSGLCVAAMLGAAGVPYSVIERNEAIGGVWWENRYPGAAVDTPNHLYQFSFARNDWSRYFASRDEIRAYLERVARDFDIHRHTRFQTEVTAATYDESAQEWSVEVRAADGTMERQRANMVISAVGAFNKPKMPRIPGVESFPGEVIHTARWPREGVELDDRRVAVVGNGASAMQLVPAIVDRAASVTVFQHSPQWAAPFEKFHVDVPEPVRFLMSEVPLYAVWYRLRQAWIFNDRIYDTLQKDPAWPHPERALNEVNDAHRRFFTRYILSELGDHQELADAVVPHYPPFGKRMLLDNRWFATLTRDDVELVTERLVEVRGDRLVTTSDTEHEADVLVLATGFDVVRFLAPMEIRGRSGRTLRDAWDDDNARAYLGTVIPDYPNLFCLYGPNTQTGHGGSVMFMMEMQAHYILNVLAQMFERAIGAVECRQDVHDEYNRRVDEAHENMVWTHPGMDTYYRNSRGRVVVNNPFPVIDYWHRTRQADLGDYVTEPARARAAALKR